MDEPTQFKDQAKRCRRLAGAINDEQARNSLERLARDYERQAGEAARVSASADLVND